MSKLFGEETLESMSQAVRYNQWTLGKIKKFLKGDILEVGCGIGNFTKTLINFGMVYAIDINKDYLVRTKKIVNGKAKIGFGDIEKGNYFFKKKKFNSIVCINVLEHIGSDNQALANLYNLLENKGFFVLLIPAHNFLYGEIDKTIGHFRRYSKKDIINRLQKLNFKIIESKRLNFLGAIGWYITGTILKKRIIEQGKIKIFNLLAPLFLPVEDLVEPPFGTSILMIAQK